MIENENNGNLFQRFEYLLLIIRDNFHFAFTEIKKAIN